jgi:hypothetical protein
MLAVLVLAAVASTAAAQGGGGMAGMPGMDATKVVKQVGPHPTGWLMRVDTPAREKEEDVNFVTMGPGMHVTAGPHATYWNPANTASGTYTISAQFGVRSTPMHDYVGLIWGGSDMGTDKVSYAYFIVGGDGTFTVKHRAGPSGAPARVGNPDVHTVIEKTANPAIKQAMKDGTMADGGSASNTLEVRVAPDSVRFVVNGTQVGAVDAKNPMMPNAGIYGFRVNHNIDVHIGGFGKK